MDLDQYGKRLVHAGELVAILCTDERSGLDAAYLRLADLARVRALPAVARTFDEACDRTHVREAWFEELFSALWRLDSSVLELFSSKVREAVQQGQEVFLTCVRCAGLGMSGAGLFLRRFHP